MHAIIRAALFHYGDDVLVHASATVFDGGKALATVFFYDGKAIYYCAIGGIRNEDMFNVLKAAHPNMPIRVELDDALKAYLTTNLSTSVIYDAMRLNGELKD